MTALVLWFSILGFTPILIAIAWRGLEGLAELLSRCHVEGSIAGRIDRDRAPGLFEHDSAIAWIGPARP